MGFEILFNYLIVTSFKDCTLDCSLIPKEAMMRQINKYFLISFTSLVPNMVVKWLTLLLHIQEIPGSNLSSETAILTEVSL
jgi:hypothetical protein